MAEAKVYISGPIVANYAEAEESGYGFPCTTLEDVTSQLDWQKPFDSVRVIINSPGGRVDVGLGIYDALRALGGVEVTTVAIGQCSSIATAIFLAGSRRLIHEHTECLVHLPNGGCSGNAQQIQDYASEMARCQQQIIDLYVARAGVDATLITEKMAAETMLTAADMLALGFATQVVQPITALATLPATKTASSPPQPTASDSALTTMAKGFADFLKSIKDAVTNLETAPKTNLSVTTTGDSPVTLTIDTGDRDAYAAGDKVYADAEMTTAAADGSYELSDGNTLTVAEGAISAVAATAAAADDAGEAATNLEQLAEAVSSLTDVVTALARDVKGIKGQQATAITNLTNQVNSLVKSGGKVALDDNAETKTNTATGGKDGEAKTADQLAAERIAKRRNARFGKAE